MRLACAPPYLGQSLWSLRRRPRQLGTMFEEWNVLVNKSTAVLARSRAVDCTIFEPHTSLFPLVSKASPGF